MKKALVGCLLLILLFSGRVVSQVYYLNNGFTNNGQVLSCAGNFKDSNPFGSYSENEQYTVTFNPVSLTGQAIQFDFDTLNIASGDTMYIYNGATTSAPLLTTLSYGDGAPLSIRATAINARGSLTVRFVSHRNNGAPGWNARLSCKSPCQQIQVKLNTIPAADANGIINICKGQEVTFLGTGVYSQNDLYYHQSDTTAKYLWSFSDGKDTSGVFAHRIKRTFYNEGGTVVQLGLVDKNECYNLVATQVKIRTALTPIFNIPESSICLKDTVRIVARPTFPEATFSNLPVFSDNQPLSDGVGKCYETSINVTKFLPNQKLTSLNDLEGVLINMEHSWLGDITIAITAPNGAKVFLKKGVGTTLGWETFLGEPVDEPSLNSPLSSLAGAGYDYLFSPFPTYGTMETEKGKYYYNYTDKAGQRQSNHPYLPAGSYKAEDDLSGLLGTTLNGLWTIEVCDSYKEDNGFIFYWTIKFKPQVYPNSEVYTSKVSKNEWVNAPGLLSTTDSLAVILPTTAGRSPFMYTLNDEFGCSFDTTVFINVLPLPAKPNLGPDTIICNGGTVDLSVNNPQAGNTYKWSTGATNVTSITAGQPGEYTVLTQSIEACKMSDTIIVVNSAPISIALGSDTMYCASSPNVLTPAITGNISSFEWSTGATTRSITIATRGTYKVTGKTTSGCLATATITALENPVNLLSLPADTTICFGTNYRLTLNPSSGTSILWNDGTTGNSHDIHGGKYSITANYKGCIKTDELEVGIRPLPIVRLGRDTTLCVGFDLPLSASYPGATYLWSTGIRDSNIIARNAGLYWVQATLNSCNYRDSLVMTQQRCDCNVKVPNAFSPNGDGINDVYRPEINCFPKDFHFSVFNRYGQLLFNTKDYNFKWNGMLNGNPLPVGTYYYILTFHNIELQKTEQFKGSITLLR
jgi:gliding motility-associated-like protein